MKAIAAAVVLSFLLCGCIAGFAGRGDLDTMVASMDSNDPSDFVNIMNKYLSSARAGDVEGMLKLTSRVTLTQFGLENFKRDYSTRVIPFLRTYAFADELVGKKFFRDVTGSYGWQLDEKVRNKEGREQRVRFSIEREDGNVLVASVILLPP